MMNRTFGPADACAAVVLVVGMLALLTQPTGCGLGGERKVERQMQNSTQVKGIHNGLILYSQGNGDQFPGLKSDGKEASRDTLRGVKFTAGVDGYHPALRYAILLNGGFFPPEFMISPLEEDRRPVEQGGQVQPQHYSYAMLRLSDDGFARQKDWANTTNSRAPVMGDRNIGGSAGAGAASVHDEDAWIGAVAYNDNSVESAQANRIGKVKFTDAPEVTNDDLFAEDSGEGIDAAWVFHDESSLVGQQ